MELFKLLSGEEIIAQLISFLILFFLLRIFLWKRLLTLLDARRKRIENEFAEIERERSDIVALRKDYEVKLATIEDEARRKIQEAVAFGKGMAQEIKREAYKEAQDIMESARKNVQFELSKVKEELKAQVIDLTVRAAEEIIQEKLTEEVDRRLVKDFLDRIDKIE